ncbi:MAG: hypothetical protein HZB46_04040 [Solirubrobacterales bacterium]|nr:hypothetical protein [Solirubrobacterales bacterium]
MICSDEACAEEAEAVVRDLGELERLACACGCTLQALEVDAWVAAAPVARRGALALVAA